MSLRERHPQLTLQLADAAYHPDALVVPTPELAMQLAQFGTGDSDDLLYLWGAGQSGKTHALLNCAARLDTGVAAVHYLSIPDVMRAMPAAYLRELHPAPVVCLDGLEHLAGDLQWEEALFHFFNAARSQHSHLLMAARARPQELGLRLADLQSRLASMVIYEMVALNDAQKKAALQAHANAYGMHLPSDVAEYWLQRFARDMGGLMQQLQQLEQLSLASHRRVSIPLLRELLHEA